MGSPEYAVLEPFTQEAVERKLAHAEIVLDNVLKRYRRVMKHPTDEAIANVRHDIISASAVILHWRSVLNHWDEFDGDGGY